MEKFHSMAWPFSIHGPPHPAFRRRLVQTALRALGDPVAVFSDSCQHIWKRGDAAHESYVIERFQLLCATGSHAKSFFERSWRMSVNGAELKSRGCRQSWQKPTLPLGPAH